MPASVPASTPSFSALCTHTPTSSRSGRRAIARIASRPTPPVDHPTTRYVMSPSSSGPGLGRKAQAHVGDRRPLDLVGPDAQRRVEPFHHLVGEPLRQRTAEPARRGRARRRPSAVAPTRPMRCSSSVTHTLLSAPSTNGRGAGVLQREHALDPADGREPVRHQTARARRAAPDRQCPRSARAAPRACASPSPTTRRRCVRASSAPLSCRHPLPTSPSTASSPTRTPSNRDRRQRPAVRSRVTLDRDARACVMSTRNIDRPALAADDSDRCARSCSTSRPCARR